MGVSVSPTVYLSKDIFIFSWENEIVIVQMDMVWRLKEAIIYIIYIYYLVCVPKLHVPNLYAYILNYWVPHINS